MFTRTYKEAIDCLNTLQSNAATLEASRASGGRLAELGMHETAEYLGRIGYSVSCLVQTQNCVLDSLLAPGSQ